MFQWLKRKAETRRIGHDIYERIVAQARDPAFFRDMGVPDTMEGRFEMIVLHLALVLDRLKTEGTPGQRLGQRLMEHLVADMDDALRQIGIGDMGVPRRVKKAAAAFVERSRDYMQALSLLPAQGGSTEDTLAAALLRHVYATTSDVAAAAPMPGASKLAAYTRRAAAHLARAPADDLFEGRGLFPRPTAFSGA